MYCVVMNEYVQCAQVKRRAAVRQGKPPFLTSAHQLISCFIHITHKAVNMEEAENKENKVMTIANVSKESRRPLDWQMTKQNLSERGQYLLETGLWSDCTFVVGLPPSQRDIRVTKTSLKTSKN